MQVVILEVGILPFEITQSIFNDKITLWEIKTFHLIPAGNYMFTVNNRNNRTRFEIYSKLPTKTPERRQWRRSDVFIVNLEHISHLVLVFLLLTLSR